MSWPLDSLMRMHHQPSWSSIKTIQPQRHKLKVPITTLFSKKSTVIIEVTDKTMLQISTHQMTKTTLWSQTTCTGRDRHLMLKWAYPTGPTSRRIRLSRPSSPTTTLRSKMAWPTRSASTPQGQWPKAVLLVHSPTTQRPYYSRLTNNWTQRDSKRWISNRRRKES